MIVDDVILERMNDGYRLSANVHSTHGIGDQPLYFLVSDAEPGQSALSGSPFLPALVLPAMALGEEIRIDAPVCPRLLWGARSAMDLYSDWWGINSIKIEGRSPGLMSKSDGRGIGLFFTAGLDSYYSLLKDVERSTQPGHKPITHLVFANFNQDRGASYDRLIDRLRRVARETEKHLVIVETNVRTLTEEVVGWNEYHGAALASVALALEGFLSRCLIASTEDYGHLPPWGSHPLLDPLWSTEGLEIIHDGVEAARVEKAARQVAKSQLAMETLIVCWRSLPDHNCGICDKCLCTMIALELADGLSRCQTLPTTLDLSAIRQQPLYGWAQCDSWRELLVHTRKHRRLDIGDAVEHALRQATQATCWKPKFKN